MFITKHLQKFVKRFTPKRFYNEDALITSHNHDFMNREDFRQCYKSGLLTGDPNRNRHWRINILLWAARSAASDCASPNDCFVSSVLTTDSPLRPF